MTFQLLNKNKRNLKFNRIAIGKAAIFAWTNDYHTLGVLNVFGFETQYEPDLHQFVGTFWLT